MVSLQVTNAGLLRIIWQLSGADYAVNVFGFDNPTHATSINQALADGLDADAKSAFTASGLAACVATSVSLSRVGIRDIHTANQPEFLGTAAAVAGASAGDLLPPQTALVVTLRTALAGPRFRGRSYLPGFTEADNAALGSASPACATAAASFVNALAAAMQARNIRMAVVSRPLVDPVTGAVTRPGAVTQVVSALVRNNVWDTQRRRAVPGI